MAYNAKLYKKTNIPVNQKTRNLFTGLLKVLCMLSSDYLSLRFCTESDMQPATLME
jgi:hypothetical protein